jgi:hypothetical protein
MSGIFLETRLMIVPLQGFVRISRKKRSERASPSEAILCKTSTPLAVDG